MAFLTRPLAALSTTSQRFWQRLATEWEGPAGLSAAGWGALDVAKPQPLQRTTSASTAAVADDVEGATLPPDASAPAVTAVQADAAPLLQVQQVSLVYATAHQQVRATHRVSLDVFAGDRFVLLGASGCGKSSLLKALAGFLTPSEGEILLGGQPVRGPGPDRVVVFQEFDQLPPWKP